ncbi:MAG: alpha-amylase family glycosyl hydrolase, partial [Robiginitomaculum sp.]|nr:alpha-amylase family glycosyl hydrolase [Robiginitomaculum sp.]
MTYRTAIIALALGATSCSALGNGTTSEAPHAEAIKPYAQRLPQDEVIYFLLPDRFENGDRANDTGGVKGGRLVNGFDPTNKGFFHGGDLKGLTQRLDYIQGLGATAIWLAPIYQNKAVQGAPGAESAGYHGYWITDFTKVDSHFGTNDDMRTFVDAAHKRGIKVYMDIVTNHTADVIAYRECHNTEYDPAKRAANACTYRSKADYPFTTRGSVNGEPINQNFMGDRPPYQTKENFEALTRADFAY